MPEDRLRELSVSVIGLGAIGRQVALQLVALGVRCIELMDFDTVELSNITTQGYRTTDLDRYKVDATCDALREIEPQIECSVVPDRYRRKYRLAPVVFCCVDSIADRSLIWRLAGHDSACWLDGRMLGEVVRVLAATDPVSRQCYAESLFPQQESQPGRCTSRSTIYAANLAAALMVHQFVRWLRGQSVDHELTFNMTASELTVVAAEAPLTEYQSL